MSEPADGELHLSQATAADAAALSALALAAKAWWAYPQDWLDRWRPQLAVEPAYLAGHWVLKAQWHGELAGFCALSADRPLELDHLWVAPAAMGKGVGRALVLAALAETDRRGEGVLRVVSDPNAESFYRHLGARRVGAEPAPMPGAAARTLPVLEFTPPAGVHSPGVYA